MEISSILLVAAVVFLVAILPVMFAARIVQARNQGILAAAGALIIAAGVEFVVGTLFLSGTTGLVLRLIIVGFVFSQVLGTDYLRGLAVSLLWGVFSVGIVMILSLFGVSEAMLPG